MRTSFVILALIGALASTNAIKLEGHFTKTDEEEVVGKKAFKDAAEADRIASGNLPGEPAKEGLITKATQA